MEYFLKDITISVTREKKNAFRFWDLKMHFHGFPAILQRDLRKLEIDF